MPEFLVYATITIPPGTDEAERLRVYDEEAAVAREFMDIGAFVRCWRVPGTRNHWALWNAPDPDYIHCAYETFPMFRLHWLRAEIHPLAVNPNDPGLPATDLPAMKMTYPVLRAHLDQIRAIGGATAMEHGVPLTNDVSIHDHPGTDRARQIHFMVGGQKLAELGPLDNEGEQIAPGYVDFLAEWMGKPVIHRQWEARLRLDNGLVHQDYAAALAAARVRHHAQ